MTQWHLRRARALQYIICGISLGYAAEAPVNTLVAEREPVDAFATFHGF